MEGLGHMTKESGLYPMGNRWSLKTWAEMRHELQEILAALIVTEDGLQCRQTGGQKSHEKLLKQPSLEIMEA